MKFLKKKVYFCGETSERKGNELEKSLLESGQIDQILKLSAQN